MMAHPRTRRAAGGAARSLQPPNAPAVPQLRDTHGCRMTFDPHCRPAPGCSRRDWLLTAAASCVAHGAAADDGQVIVAGWIDWAAEHRDLALACFREVTGPSLAEPGCLDYTMTADAADPQRIHVFERWRRAADLAEHLASGHIADFRAPQSERSESTSGKVRLLDRKAHLLQQA